MDDAYMGSIVLFAGNFEPRNWAYCDGRLLPIASYQALFSLLGTTYGGDGRTTFALPDLRGRVPISSGNGPGLTPRPLGSRAGQERVTLHDTEMPTHSHTASGTIKAKEEADNGDPSNNFIAGNGSTIFGTTSDVQMNNNSVNVTVNSAGGSQAHENMPPYLALNYIICLQGLFPPRN
jgi:microcystin-dependent protein